jgi:hypothetical protein
MRIAFIADEGSFDTDEYAMVCSVAGGEHYLMFQREVEEAGEDWGVYLEYDDQSNGGYECVAACRIDADLLSVDLAKQLGRRLVSVTGFDVTLRLSPEQAETVRAGIRRLFRGSFMNMLAYTEADRSSLSGDS